MAVKRRMYQRKVDVDMLNAVNSALADVSSVSPSSEQRRRAKTRGKPSTGQVIYSVERNSKHPMNDIYVNYTATYLIRIDECSTFRRAKK